jgi:RNA-binding protein
MSSAAKAVVIMGRGAVELFRRSGRNQVKARQRSPLFWSSNMLSSAEKRKLRQGAHHLKPVVSVGQLGVTDAVLAEVDRALEDHELIKVRFRCGDRENKRVSIGSVVEACAAEHITTVGNIAVLYRKRTD